MQLLSGTLNIVIVLFLKYINVPTSLIFADLVTTSTITFVMCILISSLVIENSVLFKYGMIAEEILDPNCVTPLTLA